MALAGRSLRSPAPLPYLIGLIDPTTLSVNVM